MSVISAGNTASTAVVISGDTIGNLVFTTGGANTTALTIDTSQNATFAGGIAGSGAAVTFQQSYGGF